MSMMESCMPAESDLPARYIQWVRYCRVWLISVHQRRSLLVASGEFTTSKSVLFAHWRMTKSVR